MNTCKTCSTFKDDGGVCNPIEYFPNASIKEFGQVMVVDRWVVGMRVWAQICWEGRRYFSGGVEPHLGRGVVQLWSSGEASEVVSPACCPQIPWPGFRGTVLAAPWW